MEIGHTSPRVDNRKCVSTENGLIPPFGVMNLEMICSPAIRTKPRLVRKKEQKINPACLLVARVTIRGLYSVSCRNIKAFLSVPGLTSPGSKKPSHREHGGFTGRALAEKWGPFQRS